MTTMNTAQTAIEFDIEELRALAKSVSKTRDAELRKLIRLTEGSAHHSDVKADFAIIDELDSKISNAISEAVRG